MEFAPMKRRNVSFPVLVLALLAGLLVPDMAEARQRMEVLLVPLNRAEPGRGRFGQDVTRALQGHLDELDTHVSVSFQRMRETMNRLRVRPEELDCITGRQLAVQMDAALVFCGTWDPQPDNTIVVEAEFVQARTGESFQVPTVTATSADDAAQQVFEAFHTYIRQLERTSFCEDYLDSEQWVDALNNCLIAVELNPQSVRAQFSLGYAYLELDSLRQSLEAFRKVLEMTDYVHDDALLTAGIVATRIGEREEARRYFSLYLDLNPGDTEVRITVAHDVAEAGDDLAALEIVESGLELDPDSLDLLDLKEWAGTFSMRAAQTLIAEQLSDQEELDPRAAELLEKAIEYYEHVFEAYGEEAEETMLSNMMATLNLLGRRDDAVDLGGRIVAVKPETPRMWSIYADALSRVDRIEEALAALDSLAVRDPEYERLTARRGQWYLRLGRAEDARDAFADAVERGDIDSESAARFFLRHAQDYQRAEEYSRAYEIYGMADQFAELPETRGMVAFFQGFIRYTQAEQMVQAAGGIETAETARRVQPLFNDALAYFQASAPYAAIGDREASQVRQFMEGAERYLEIIEIVIRRGR